jgi:hypothetical protein
MNYSPATFVTAATLVMLGVAFAWIERHTAATRELLPATLREFATARSRRRVRIAALLIFVGALMACGNLTDPDRYPLRFVAIWGLTALLAVSMLCYGLADFYYSRVLWIERMRRTAAPLADAARRARREAEQRSADESSDAPAPPAGD